jgi:predicted CoA-substrate-specific enzyme activase
MKYLGVDIGSISICLASIDYDKRILSTDYYRHAGAPEKRLKEILARIDFQKYRGIAFTGTGGKHIAELLGCPYVNEISATASGLAYYLPDCRCALEMGGQGSKYYLLKDGALVDFSTSGLCAAGTGSFLDQQAARLNVAIENEFGELALKSTNPPHIAGRCSVFAKSDMIHHQQIGTPDYDIIAGLCYAVTRNFKSTILRKKTLPKPVAFIGGVALNKGVVKAFEEELDLRDGGLYVPDNNLFFAALGAALAAILEYNTIKKPDIELNKLDNIRHARNVEPVLKYANENMKHYETTSSRPRITSQFGYLGVDIGSLSTNVVVIDPAGNVMARRYLMTEGRPIKAVQKGLREVAAELAGRVKIIGAGTTGSGRYLIGDIIGADIVRNEITAQAKAAIFFDPNVDTIFEIGGQDSKYISIRDGIVVDFEMNKACAAGTGSFLQEQAEKLDICIEDQFGKMALDSRAPVSCGERCTVFIESDIVSHQQQGAPREDLVAGLAYSIVHNYLNKVVSKRRIGENIFFQGGVAWNKGVVAAFESVIGKPITVPPHHDVTGAIGAALLAKESIRGESKFKGFGVSEIEFKQESFICHDCANVCTIRKITGDDGRELFYGSRCEKYDAEKSSNIETENPVSWRNQLMFSYGHANKNTSRGTIGIPRLLSTWSFWPLWSVFFNELGFRVISSAPTNSTIIRQGAEIVGSETCFPVKVAHGHLLNLLSRGVDYIFLPSMINMPSHPKEETNSYFCPYVQSMPFLAKAVMGDVPEYAKVISPSIYFGYGDRLSMRLMAELGMSLGASKGESIKAFRKAQSVLADFNQRIIEKGRELLSRGDKIKLILVGRPYNTCDPGLNLDLAKKIAGLGAICIPPDMVPVDTIPINETYWHFGKTILRIADFVNKHDDVYPIYISNFGCGPDSFIGYDFSSMLKDKPYLQLELDEHSADAGLITRIEAFLDSIRSRKPRIPKPITAKQIVTSNGYKRKLYIPNMSDQAYLFESALKYCGLDAEVMPESNDKTLQIGRKFTSGKECYPAVLTTGDLISLVQRPDFDTARSAFFMPSAGGPCRFGQYHRLHRKLLDDLGFIDVPIYSPHSGDSYNNFPGTLKGFRKLAWRGFVFGDYLYKIYLSARAKSGDLSKAELIFKEGFKAGCDDILTGGNRLKQILSDYGNALANLDNGRRPKAKIGLVGEIYIRNNRFSNNQLVAKLEKYGAEVYIATFSEWIAYTTYMYKYHSRLRRQYGELVKAYIKDIIQSREEHGIVSATGNLLDGNSEKPVDRIIEYALPYLSNSVGGEAILSIGKAIDYVKSGCSGIVNCMPFTCMPGNITQALSLKVSADLGGVPWLNIAYEGPGDPIEDLKIEAFVDQAANWQKRNRDLSTAL